MIRINNIVNSFKVTHDSFVEFEYSYCKERLFNLKKLERFRIDIIDYYNNHGRITVYESTYTKANYHKIYEFVNSSYDGIKIFLDKNATPNKKIQYLKNRNIKFLVERFKKEKYPFGGSLK